MPKKSSKPTILSNNQEKHLCYRAAWGRIRQSIAHGYYLEAITLEESIMSDRLISYLVKLCGVQPDGKLERQNFVNLIRDWRKHHPETISDQYVDDLQDAIDQWRMRRNRVVHGMVKSVPGADHRNLFDFKQEAELTASQGDALARSLCNWYDRAKRKARREIRALSANAG